MSTPHSQKKALTPQEHQALECALIREILETLQQEPRRTTVVLSSLVLLIRGFAQQLPPEGIADVALMTGALAGELLELSANAAAHSINHLPASMATH